MYKYALVLIAAFGSAISTAQAGGHGHGGGFGCVGGYGGGFGCFGGFVNSYGCFGGYVNSYGCYGSGYSCYGGYGGSYGCYGGQAWAPVYTECYGGNPTMYGRGRAAYPYSVVGDAQPVQWVKQDWPGGIWRIEDGGDGMYYPAGAYYVAAPLTSNGPVTGTAPANSNAATRPNPTNGPDVPANGKGPPAKGNAPANGKAPPRDGNAPVLAPVDGKKPPPVPVHENAPADGTASKEKIGLPEEKQAKGPAPATIVVQLPADAKLSVNGTVTRSTSTRRTFESPPLEPGKEFHYTLKAELQRDGQTLVASKRVAVRAGEEQEVLLEFTTARAER
jgi:uncharacterized protein (TIGR03000 family)